MIILPMAGRSRRFYEAGYTCPKYELPLDGQSLFAACVRSFEHYFRTERFLFVCRDDGAAVDFVDDECKRLGIADYRVVRLRRDTGGQAESVLLGLQDSGCGANESLLIFNIDTIRESYRFPVSADFADGYLEVFRGPGTHWSFVQPSAAFGTRVAQTSEKQRISPLCCTGLYYFARASDFTEVCGAALNEADEYRQRWGELYIAPLYNAMLAQGRRVVYHEITREQVRFAGTPEEYRGLLAERPALC